MAIGQIIGRVSIKLLPDSSDFRRMAQRDLDRIEDQLSVSVHCKIDFNQMRRDLLQGIRDINRENRELESRKVRVLTALKADRVEFRHIIREYQRMANGPLGKVTIKTKLVADNLHVELNEESLDRVKRRIERWKNDVEPIKIKAELVLSDTDVRRTSLRLLLLSRTRNATIRPTLDKKAYAAVATSLAALSGGRLLRNTLRNLTDYFKGLDKSVPIIGSLALAVIGLAGGAATAASNLFSLSASLASIGPAGLLLPGLLGGIAVGVGVMVAAFKDFNKVFPDVKKKLADLQNVISSNFWAKAKAPIRELIDETFPLFQAGMKKTATQLGAFFGNLATDLRTHLAPALKQMFDDLSESIDRFSEHTGSIAKIIALLGRVGANRLPQLADWFGKLTDQFANFLEASEKDGKLKQWIDDAITAIKDLGSVVKNLFSIFASLGRAAEAAGGSTLGTLADTLERLADAAKSVGFQEGLTRFLKAAHVGVDNLTRIAGPAFKKFLTTISELSEKLLPLVGTALGTAFEAIFEALSQPAVVKGVLALFQGLSDAIDALAPAMGPLGLALGAVGEIIGEMARSFAPILASVLTTLADLFVEMTPHILPLIQVLSGGLLDAVTALAPVFKRLAPVIGKFIDAGVDALVVILPTMVTLFETLAGTVGDVLIQVFEALAPVLPGIAQSMADMVTALTPLIPVLGDALIALVPLLPSMVDGFSQLVIGLTPLIPQFIELAINLLPLIVPLVQALVDSLPVLVDTITNLTGPLGDILLAFTAIIAVFGKPIFDTIGDLLVNLVGDVKWAVDQIVGLWNLMVGVITLDWAKGFSDIGHTINDFVLGVGGFFADLPGIILNAVGDLGMLLFDVGKAVIGGLIDGLWSAVTAPARGLLSVLHTITNMIPFHKGPIAKDRVLLFGAGQAIIGGLVNGLESRYDVVRKSLRGLTNEIGNTVVTPPSVAQANVANAVSRAIDVTGVADAADRKTFIYNAAPGSSLGSEEDLFAAADRSRFGGF